MLEVYWYSTGNAVQEFETRFPERSNLCPVTQLNSARQNRPARQWSGCVLPTVPVSMAQYHRKVPVTSVDKNFIPNFC
jgi:hypothetical protein